MKNHGSNSNALSFGMSSLLLLALAAPLLAQPVDASRADNTTEARTVIQPQQFTGEVVCAARTEHRYQCMRSDTLQSCEIRCVQAGSHYVFQVGDHVYQLLASPKQLQSFAGGKATITGTMTGDGIKVSAVSKASR